VSPLHSTISRFVTGDYLAPPASRFAGQRVVAVAYLVRHPDATLLFDTGFPFDAPTSVNEDDDPIPTFPRPLEALLAAAGTSMDQLDLVANCHLHIDHSGGNFRLPATLPIYVQQTELDEARADEEPLVRDALATDRLAYRPVAGEHEVLPGLRLVPTPGHTAGHQSMVVDTDGGPVVLLGQAMPSATDFASAVYAVELQREGSDPVPPYPDWLPRMMDIRPQRVMLAHDLAVWQPEPASA
jgi:glyoxylase-like metal-dependent hydrolase (beta-lactamase superfamily II)